MIDFNLGRNVHGESRLTIELVGSTDVLRFAVNMLSHQVEFCQAGRVILVELRERIGADRFDPWATSMLGAERFEKLRPHYMERDTHCVVCEREVADDEPRRALSQAQIVCADCDDPDEAARSRYRPVETIELPAASSVEIGEHDG